MDLGITARQRVRMCGCQAGTHTGRAVDATAPQDFAWLEHKLGLCGSSAGLCLSFAVGLKHAERQDKLRSVRGLMSEACLLLSVGAISTLHTAVLDSSQCPDTCHACHTYHQQPYSHANSLVFCPGSCSAFDALM